MSNVQKQIVNEFTTKKKLHHYVYRLYLAQWNNNSNYFVFDRKESKVFIKKHAKELAVKSYFYSTVVDKDVYDMIIYKYRDILGKGNSKSHINEFISTIQTLYHINKYQKLKLFNYQKLSFFDTNVLEVYYNLNIEEPTHSVLRKIIDCPDFSKIKLTIIDFKYLLMFAIFQYTRTIHSSNIVNTVIDKMFIKDSETSPPREFSNQQKNTFLKLVAIGDVWIFLEKYSTHQTSFSFIRNKTDTDFITSDHPILFKMFQDVIIIKFALTPKIALTIHIHQTKKCILPLFLETNINNAKTIHEFNDQILENCGRYFYFTSEQQRDSFFNNYAK